MLRASLQGVCKGTMDGKYFGTAGIRGRANSVIGPELALRRR